MVKIQKHETWDIIDSSKMQTYMRCPRKYFWRYVLGLAPDVKSIHLSFGKALHEGFEYLLQNKDQGDQAKRIAQAFDKFMDSFKQEVPEGLLDAYPPKTPGNAMAALALLDDIISKRDFKVLHTEVHGDVLIEEEKMMTFRIDAIIEDSEGVKVVDLKTSSRLGSTWAMQWELSPQMGLYVHAARSYYDNVWGAEVWGVGVYKSKAPEFQKAAVQIPLVYANAWLYTIQHWYNKIKEDHYLLKQDEELGRLRKSFVMNPMACTDYGGCIYHDLCSIWHNPLEHLGEVPSGFKIEWWDPKKED